MLVTYSVLCNFLIFLTSMAHQYTDLFSDEWSKYVESLESIFEKKHQDTDYDQIINSLEEELKTLKRIGRKKEKWDAMEKKIKENKIKREMRPVYIEYAKNHKKIRFKTDEEMFLRCNQYHNMQNLNGKKIYTKCYKQERKCNNTMVLRFVRKDWKVHGLCGCGNLYWDHVHPPDDMIEFNLSSTHTYGSDLPNW